MNNMNTLHIMKRLSLVFWFIVLAFHFISVSTSNAACGLEVRLDTITVSTNCTKVGFPALVRDPQNPTIYFHKEITNYNSQSYDAESSTYLCLTCHDRYSSGTRSMYGFSLTNLTTPVCTDFFGTVNKTITSRATNGEAIIDNCTYSTSNLNDWSSNPGCTGNASCNFDNSVFTTNEYILNAAHFRKRLSYSSQGDLVSSDDGVIGSYTNTAAQYQDVQLTDSYSLSDFINNAQGCLNTLPWPSWTNATENGVAEYGSITNVIYPPSSPDSIDTACFKATYGKLKFRIAFRGNKDDKARIEWRYIFIPMDGGPPITNAVFYEDVTFTGGLQYIQKTGGESGIELGPPTSPGWLMVKMNTTWQCSSEGCQLGQVTENVDSVNVKFGLGSRYGSAPAGYLYINSDSLGSGLGTPQSLTSFLNHDSQVIMNGGAIRQVRVPEGLADIVTVSGQKYEIRFYTQAGNWNTASNCYVPGIDPIKTVAVEYDSNTLRITDGNSGPACEYTSDTSNDPVVWNLTTKQGTAVIRRETLAVSVNQTSQARSISGPNNSPLYAESSQWQTLWYGLGRVRLSQIVSPNQNPRTNLWNYYTNTGDTNRYGLLSQIVQDNGYWERYDYDNAGRLTNKTCQFKTAATNATFSQSRAVTYSYDSVNTNVDHWGQEPLTARTTVEWLLGHPISQRYTLISNEVRFDVQCASYNAAWNNSGNLITTTRVDSVAGFDGTLTRVWRPDGTMSSEAIGEPAPGLSYYHTNEVGQPNAQGLITNGTRTITTYRPDGRPDNRVTTNIVSGTVLDQENYTYDSSRPYGPVTQTTYLDGRSVYYSYSCCALESMTDRDGVTTSYGYDAMHRQVTTTRLGITTSNVLDAAGNVVGTVRIGTDGSAITLSTQTYDQGGRVTVSANALGQPTYYADSFANGMTLRTVTLPNGGTRIETNYPDGSLAGVGGTATAPTANDNGIEQVNSVWQAYSLEKRLVGSSGNEWVKSYTDFLGRSYLTLYADGSSQVSYFNICGQLAKAVNQDGGVMMFRYNGLGEQEFAASLIDTNQSDFQLNGSDRITRTVNDYEGGYRRTRTFVWYTNGQDAALLVDTVKINPNGLDTIQTRDNQTTYRQTTYPGNGIRMETVTMPDQSKTISTYMNGRLESVTRSDAANQMLSRVIYTYDAHGRQSKIIDARSGMTTLTYNDGDQVVSVTAPPPGTGQSAPVTQYEYNEMGQVLRTVLPDGSAVTNSYDLRGQKLLVAGSGMYPTGYGYDSQGRLLSLTNWSDFASGSGARVTHWYYNGYRGWLTNKVYPNNDSIGYIYTPSGRLQQRIGGRVATTYSYNPLGDLASVNYSDGTTTPASTFGYDRRGLVYGVTNGSTVTLREFNSQGVMITERYVGGVQDGLIVSNRLNTLGQLTGVMLWQNNTLVSSTGYGYDSASRLTEVTNGNDRATYRYVAGANSPLVQDRIMRHSSTVINATARTFDRLNRLTGLASTTPVQPAQRFAYQYNLLNQRTQMVREDGSVSDYGYDSMGQLTNAAKHWVDGQAVAGQQFNYAYDTIGNRVLAKSGGDSSGQNLRVAYYTNNSANQLTGNSVPTGFDVLGESENGVAVTVNNQSASRHDTYFQAALTVNNTTGAVHQTVDVTGGTEYLSGNVFVPKHPEAYGHDADGNLVSDGRFNHVWDGENQLIQSISRTSTPPSSWVNVQYGYDWQRRRTSKTVSAWNVSSNAYVSASSRSFVYHGWNLVGILNSNAQLLTSFVWGNDASGSLQGAGGVGGLLAVILHTGPNAGTYYPAYDGNHNIVAYVRASDGVIVAEYKYSPFGVVIRATGPMAREFNFLFSTKYYDWETKRYYYGYRFYDPEMEKWMSRDPMGEQGGENLYEFCRSDPVTHCDIDGRFVAVNNPISDIVVNIVDQWNTPDKFKESGYHFWRDNFVTAPHWQKVMDDWYYEREGAHHYYRGNSDPRNVDIANNSGFQHLLNCWVANKRGAKVPTSSEWTVRNDGFWWRYGEQGFIGLGGSAGGSAAYTPATHFLGSYDTAAKVIGKRGGKLVVSIDSYNLSHWVSGTRSEGIPFLGSKEHPSFFTDHAQGQGPEQPSSRGGNMDQHYLFTVEVDECAKCVLP